jgi:hypothetical protein
LVTSKLGDFKLAIEIAKTALGQLDEIKKGYSEDDKNYLRYYCRLILEYSAVEETRDTFRDSRAMEVRFGSLRFDKMQADLKRNFPITQAVASERSQSGTATPL